MVEGTGTSLASHYRCLILGLDFPTSHDLPPPTLLSYNEAFPFQNLPPYLAPVDCTDCNTKSGSCPTQRSLPSYLKLTSEQRFGNRRRRFKRKVRIKLSIITSFPPNSCFTLLKKIYLHLTYLHINWLIWFIVCLPTSLTSKKAEIFAHWWVSGA